MEPTESKYSRQAVTGAALAAIGPVLTLISLAFGIDIPEEVKVTLVENIEDVITGTISAFGVILLIFRKITKSPMVGLLKKEV